MATIRKVADTILQQPIGSVMIEGETYEIAPPTTATLLLVSDLIAELPELTSDIKSPDFIGKVLESIKDCKALGQIAAILILGAKRIKQEPMTTTEGYIFERKWSWRKFKKVTERVKKPVPAYLHDVLAEKILDSMTAKELHELISNILSEAHLADFFVLTTSLRTKRLTAPTREVETTASGHSSEAGLNIGN